MSDNCQKCGDRFAMRLSNAFNAATVPAVMGFLHASAVALSTAGVISGMGIPALGGIAIVLNLGLCGWNVNNAIKSFANGLEKPLTDEQKQQLELSAA